jgi:hypothetical protein
MKTKFFVAVIIFISSFSTAVFAQTSRENTIEKNVRLVEGNNTIDFGRAGTLFITRRGGKTVAIRMKCQNNLKQLALGNHDGSTNGGLDCECGIKVITEGWAECIPCPAPGLPFIPSGDLTRIVWKLDDNNSPNTGN